ncbi:29049_t:CDS:10 [Gigaspora margarita]|uniref:29049_t:CDS:1 n=1 Tax=Gigaspora margarita TaxID=4874 RepID=A0ABN7TYB1_GIGMA|nr:29049_t:CDS:10 [Gigaspora margarita]
MFILHSLPDFDNDQLITKGYIQEEKLLELRNKVLDKSWFFLIGTSGSGKTRSLFELFCHIYGIYFAINAENGIKMNLGSKDLDIVINELENYLTNNHEKNNRVALRFTQMAFDTTLVMWKGLLGLHFLCFRELKEKDQNKLIINFTERFKSLIPKQEKLPIAIDESQAAIKRTGMAFDDIKFYTQSAIAKSGGPTSDNFFTINDGFYELSHQRFLVQFLEQAILNTSSKSHSNLDNAKVVWNKVWDITIFSMFSRWSKHVRGDCVAEMVQYGFAQLDSIDGPTDLSIFENDGITIRIAGLLPILAFIEYVREKPKDLPGEIEKQLLQNLYRHAGPDLVCIVQFHSPNGIIEVPLFLQAKLVKDTPPNDAKYTTDPHHFYLSRNGSKINQKKTKQGIYPANISHKSTYGPNESQRKRISSNNNQTANELHIAVNHLNAEHFFSEFGLGVLQEVKRVRSEEEIEQKKSGNENKDK